MFLALEKQLGIELSSVSIQGKFSELILSLYNRENQRVVVLIDMAVIYKNTCYIFEFKVIELTEKGKPLNQIKKMKYYEKYTGYASSHIDSGKVEEIFLIGVEFSKKDRNITNFEWERV